MQGNKKLWGRSALLATVLPLASMSVIPAASAVGGADGVSDHHVYVAKVANYGEFDANSATMLANVDEAIARWEDEADGEITFDRVGNMIEYASTEECGDGSREGFRAEAMERFEAKYPGLSFGGSSGNHIVVMVPASCIGDSGAYKGSSFTSAGGGLAYSYASNKGTQSLLHELGHNFGLQHAQAIRCATADCAATPYKYGNKYEIMGVTTTADAGKPAWVPPSFGSYERDLLGIEDIQTVALAAGSRIKTQTVELRGRGTGTGERGIKVVDPADGSTYYLNFRNGLGSDAGSWYAAQTQPKTGEYFNKGVSIQKVGDDGDGDEMTVLQGFATATADGTVWRHGWTTGQEFGSGGVRIQVEETQLNGAATDIARIRITLTDPSYQPDHTVAVSQSTASVVRGASKAVTVTVGSQDGFSASTSLTASGLPAGVTASFAPTSVTPTANGSATSTMTLTASSTATVGTWTVKVSATSGTVTRTANVELTVTAPAPSGPVTLLSKTGLSGGYGESSYVTVNVPAGAKSLTFKTSGGTGDVDLYARFNAKPTSTYNCESAYDGNNETCTVSAPAAGTWYLELYGWEKYSGVSLNVTYTK